MENQKQYPMTQEGYEKLEQELEELKTVKRPEVVEKIKVARSFGDLSENSEYDAAKDEQGFIEQDIQRTWSFNPLPISAFAIGDSLEIFPLNASASAEPTIW